MKRGEIYLIKRRDTIGAEITKTRPAVIVSNNFLNTTGDVVEVVYLTTAPRRDLPEHVHIHATGQPSVAICEQIDSVSRSLVCGQVGTCSEEEMAFIDAALLASLAITDPRPAAGTDPRPAAGPVDNLKETDPVQYDPVNRPSHYTSGRIEVIDFIEDKALGFRLGNAVKYIARAGKKDPTKTVEDLRKAVWYLTREIEKLEEAANA